MMPLMTATTAKTAPTTGWPRSHQASAAAPKTQISTTALPNGSSRNTALGERNRPQSRIAKAGARIPTSTPGQGRGQPANPQKPRLAKAKSSSRKRRMSLGLILVAPAFAILLWGLFRSPKAVFRLDPFGKAVVEICVFGAAALAWWDLGQPVVGAVFAVVAVISGIISGRKELS